MEIRPELMNCMRTSLNVIEILSKVWVRGFYSWQEKIRSKVIR